MGWESRAAKLEAPPDALPVRRPVALLRSTLALAAVLLLAGCEGGGGLVGTWEPVGGGGPASRTTFFADGSARIVTRTDTGEDEAYDARYRVEGDTVLTLADEQGAERFRFRVSTDTLVLESPATGMRTVLTRVRG